MSTTEAQPQPAAEVPHQEPAPAAEVWPRTGFEREVWRLRAELEAAIRIEKSKADEIAALENQSFSRSLPVSVLAGPGKLEKLSSEQDAAQVATQRARDALHKFVDDERGRFFALKDDARRRLNPEITAQFERTKAAARELISRLQERLGASAEIAHEEKQIYSWNRAAVALNRTLPTVNENNIPRIALIDTGDSLRSVIEGMLIGDPALRELVRGTLTRDAEARQRAEAHREFLEREAVAGTIRDPAFDRVL